MVATVTERAEVPETRDGAYLETPGPILLLGAPGAGKGTQSKALAAEWSVPQISTGDLLREVRRDPVQSATPLGRQIRSVMDAGHLVSDDLVQAMVLDRLARPDVERGYVLDGFPRTLPQAEWLDAFLLTERSAGGSKRRGEDSGCGRTLPVVAVNIQVSYTNLLRRVTGRRTCPACARIYNIYSHPPKQDTVCDVDGTALVQRPDDVEEIFSERIRTYESLTAPVVAHYRALGQFAEVDGEQPVDCVTRGVRDAIVRLRG